MLIPDPDRADTFITSTGQTITNVHAADACRGFVCTVHNPSEHHMMNGPLHWWSERGIFVRLCEHNVPHPDPDTDTDQIHHCDGCCVEDIELEPV